MDTFVSRVCVRASFVRRVIVRRAVKGAYRMHDSFGEGDDRSSDHSRDHLVVAVNRRSFDAIGR